MHLYQIFYVVYWGIFIGYILWRTDWIVNIWLFCKTVLHKRNTYKVQLSYHHIVFGPPVNFGSIDGVAADNYGNIYNDPHRITLSVEDISSKKELNNKYAPTMTFIPLANKFVVDKSWGKKCCKKGNSITVSVENIITRKRIA
jgi:hypothetical protein